MKLSLSLNTKVTILTLAVLPILLGLGRWQLERAAEKREIAMQFLSRQQQPAVSIDKMSFAAVLIDDSREVENLAYTPVQLSGSFDDQHQFLLDNRMHDRQLGYEVLTPFVTTGGQWVLVNRGWIRGYPDRRTLPDVPVIAGELLTHGSIYVSPGNPFLLKEQTLADPQWPLVVQAVEVEKFSAALDRSLFPHVVRLDRGAPGALTIDWQLMNQQPEKHVAYAVQWLAMSLALLVWFGFSNTTVRHLFTRRQPTQQ